MRTKEFRSYVSLSYVDKIFIIYVPGSELTQIHERTTWLYIPRSFKDLGYYSAIICGKYSLKSSYGIEVHSTLPRNKSLLKSLIEPFLGFRYIFRLEPDILLISPIGSYLFSIIPLILIYKMYTKVTRSKRTKIILKTDWSLEFINMGKYKKALSILLLILSSHVFDRVSLETYCGIKKAKAIPFIKARILERVPVGFPQNINFNFPEDTNRKNRILCVARITQMKGQIILLKSFLNLFQKYPEWELRFIGPVEDSDYKRQLDSLIHENHVENRVLFTNFVEENILLNELRWASIFCLPSVFGESAGNVKYEAIVAGLPVLSTDVPCREDDEELGLLVSKAGDVNDLTKNLEILIRDPQMRRNIAEGSRKKIVSYRDLAILYRDL